MDLRRHGAARRQTHNQPQGADRLEASKFGKVPIDRLAEIAPKARISRARVVDAGRIITAGGIASGMEMGFHLLRRAGFDEALIGDVARVMEYKAATTSIETTSNTAPESRTRNRVFSGLEPWALRSHCS
jgi:hypothetical protein